MRLGAHMSIAGGMAEAIRRGVSTGCQTIQLFTKNNNRWAGRRLSPGERQAFFTAWKASGLDPVFAHNAYLINLASADASIRRRSIQAMIEEVATIEELGLPFLVMHPGSHGGTGEEEGLDAIVRGLNEIIAATPGARGRILLETTAGQGHSLGHRFEHFRIILDGVAQPERLGVCLDTCHVFAAGYELRTAESYQQTFDRFDRIVGREQIRAFHLNDSKRDLGSRVDRHEHIGQGLLGWEPFRLLLNDPRLAGRPAVLETPKDKDGEFDRRNLAVLRSLIHDQPAQ